MGLFDKIFRPRRYAAETYFKTLTAYRPTFHRWGGALYESELVRAAIDARARHNSKLEIRIDGAAQPRLQTILKKRPNRWQTWSQFLYRASTILDMQNTLFIVPILARDNTVTGLWTCLPSSCRILEDRAGTEWLEYKFSTGDVGAVELSRCGVLTRFQYEDDFFGADNRALDSTMDLLELERQGVKEGIESSASFRFMARQTNWKDPEDLVQEQKNFTERNLSADAGGFLLFPNNYDSIQQITSKPYTVPTEELELIQRNVCDYYGVNEDIIQSKAVGAALDGFYEGVIEPFAIQLSEVLTFMLFTDTEIGYGTRVYATANRLQYMSTADKVSFIANLSDRGYLTINEGRELLNYPPIEGGDVAPIRGEYYFVGDDADPAEEEPDASET